MNDDDYKNELVSLGKRIKQIRKHRNHTLVALEVLSGINDSDLSRYERGVDNIEFHTLFKIANALKVSISVLTDYDGDIPS